MIKFNLPASLIEAIPQIDTSVIMHNDGVV